jgi:hypothetical protein
MNNKEYEKVLNQYIELLIYDIDYKKYELKSKIPNDIENADKIFNIFYKEKIREFINNTKKAKKVYYK